MKVKLPPKNDYEVDILSVSSSSERIEGLWVVFRLYVGSRGVMPNLNSL